MKCAEQIGEVKEQLNEEWFNKEMRHAIEEKSEASSMYLQIAKREYYKGKITEIDESCNKRQYRKLYKDIRQQTEEFKHNQEMKAMFSKIVNSRA